MILVGNQRGGATDLARHLLKEENERVRVHDIRGFVADDLPRALQESYALSRGTRCKQHLYSLSLSPPPEEAVGVEVFENAIERVERRLGLTDQPRAIVFHEKNGRRHAHAVWCRVDIENMRAIPLSHDRVKLQEIARDLYIEHKWRMPQGFLGKEFRDPRNFSLAEWQQAKRTDKDPKHLKTLFQDCWAVSDSKPTFAHALKERGFVLAQGDRRGFVAVDHTGEVFAVARWGGLKTKQVKERLGAPDDLPSVAQAHKQAAQQITTRLDDLKTKQLNAVKAEQDKAQRAIESAQIRHRQERRALADHQAQRRNKEDQKRQARLKTGLRGLWERITGKRKRVIAENAKALERAQLRDQREKTDLSDQHRAELSAQFRGFEHLKRTRDRIIRELADDIQTLKRSASNARDGPDREASPRLQKERRSNRRRKPRDGPRRKR